MGETCPNCGHEVAPGRDRCENCGKSLDFGARLENAKRVSAHWLFGNPLGRFGAWTFAIVGGLLSASMAGCGLCVAVAVSDDGYKWWGWIFFVAGALVLWFVIVDARRSLKKK